MEYNKLPPQGCQHPHLLDPGLPARADGLLWLLVVLGGQFSNVECNQPGLWRWYLVVGLLTRPYVGPAAGVLQPEEGVIPTDQEGAVVQPGHVQHTGLSPHIQRVFLRSNTEGILNSEGMYYLDYHDYNEPEQSRTSCPGKQPLTRPSRSSF